MDKPISLLPRQPNPIGTDRVPLVRTSEPESANRNQYSTLDDMAGYLSRSLSLTGTQANEFFIGEEFSQSQDIEYRVLVFRTLDGSPGVARGIRWQGTPAGLQVELVRCLAYQSPPTNPLNTWEADKGGGDTAEEIEQVASRTVGGKNSGTNYTYLDNANGRLLKDILTPENAPTVILNITGADKRQPGADLADLLTAEAEPESNNLASAIITGPNGFSYALSVGDGTAPISEEVGVAAGASGKSEWTLTATDVDGLKSSVKASITVQSKRFWGALSIDPATATAAALSTALKALAGQEFSESRAQTRTITLANQYPVFAYKATAGVPTVKVAGLTNSSFQARAFTFINSEGEPESFLLIYGSLNSGAIPIELL